MALSDDRIWKLAEVHTKYDRNTHVVFFARAVEAEVRKQDDALIQQLVEALETCDEGDGYNGPYQYHSEIAVESAITAGRARLGGTK